MPFSETNTSVIKSEVKKVLLHPLSLSVIMDLFSTFSNCFVVLSVLDSSHMVFIQQLHFILEIIFLQMA